MIHLGGRFFYNFLSEIGIPMILVRLEKLCLYETHGRVRVVKYLFEFFPIKNILKQGDALSPLIFNFTLEYAVRRVQVNQDGLTLNGTHQSLVYADDDSVLGGNVHTVNENTEALVVAIKESGLELIVDKSTFMVVSRY